MARHFHRDVHAAGLDHRGEQPLERGRLGRELNEFLTLDNKYILGLVDRGRVSAHSNTLEGVRLNTWDSELWNIADWSRAAQ